MLIWYSSGIVLYDDNIILLFKLRASLQGLLNRLYEFCASCSLEVNLSKTKIMIFACNKIKLNQEAFYLDKDSIDIPHEYKYLKIHFCSHGYFEPSNKRQGITSMKDVEVKVTCRELKSHLFKALMLHGFMYGTEIWGGDFQNSHWKVFKNGMKMHMMSHVKMCSLATQNMIFSVWLDLVLLPPNHAQH
jgi:hypothetical protein